MLMIVLCVQDEARGGSEGSGLTPPRVRIGVSDYIGTLLAGLANPTDPKQQERRSAQGSQS